jgi:hypothetical protein
VPAKPQGLLKVPEILERARRLDAPVLDRPTVESLFGLKRRRAIELMHAFSGYRASGALLIDRAALIGALERILRGDEFRYERRRAEKLAGQLDRMRRASAAARVTIPVGPGAGNRRLSELPEGVRLDDSRLTIDFSGPQDLLRKLFELAQALANDVERLQALG